MTFDHAPMSAAATHYNLDRYYRSLTGPTRAAFRGGRLRVGEQAPEVELVSVDGDGVSLARLRRTGPVALVFGCWTAPPAVEQMSAIDALSATTAARATVVFVYTREIHAGEDLYPGREPVPAHRSLDDKIVLARRFRDELAPSVLVAVDDLEGTAHTAYGGLPVLQAVVDRDGTLVHLADWASSDLLEAVLDNLDRRRVLEGSGRPRIAYSETLWCTTGLSRH